MPAAADYQKLYGAENTPLKVGDPLYICTAKNVIVALDAAKANRSGVSTRSFPTMDPYTPPAGRGCYKVPGAAANSPCASRIIEGTLDAA